MFTLMALIIGHYFADFPMQNDFMALNKVPGKFMWAHLLVAHCAVQAGAVLVITHSCPLAFAEFVAHFITDYAKGKNWIDLNLDQTIHILCKVLWTVLFLKGIA